jgi:hypothetical protein
VGLALAGRGRLELGRGQDREAEPGGQGLPGGHPQPVAPEQVADGQVGRVGRLLDLAGDRLELEQAGGQLGVEPTGLVPAAAGADEPLPLDDPVVGQGVEVAQLAAEGGEGEQQPEGGVGEVEVEIVGVPDHGVAEAEPGHGELERQEERLGLGVVEAVAAGDDGVHDRRVGDPLEEVVEHDVLVVLAHQPACLLEGPALVDQAVVGLEEGQVQLGDDQVLVVAGVADAGRPVAQRVGVALLPGQVVVVTLARRPLGWHRGPVELGDLADQHLGLVGRVARGRRAVQAVELQAGRAQVLEVVADLGQGQRRQAGGEQLGGGEGAGLEGDVVVHELAEVGVDGRYRAVAGGRAGVDHGPAELLQAPDRGRRPGQQVGRVVLELGEQEVEVLEGRRGRDREPEVDLGGALGQGRMGLPELVRRGRGSVRDPWHCRRLSYNPKPGNDPAVSARGPAGAGVDRRLDQRLHGPRVEDTAEVLLRGRGGVGDSGRGHGGLIDHRTARVERPVPTATEEPR